MSLHTLYVDLNSFFASVEQQLRPELRNRAVGVLPVMADTTCCIAASIDAKRYGIKTGTPVWQARKLCRDIIFVQARPATYVDIHHRIVAAVESCTPVGEVLSIDEMACELMGRERQEAHAIALGKRIKKAIYTQVGEMLHCSIGIAPNRFLAKTASNMQKPDGLVVIRQQDLPHCLYGLKLRTLNGIGRAMEDRLNRLGIHTVQQLCAASIDTLRHAWNGVEGERYYAKLRGKQIAAPPKRRSSLGHSHVLPPDMRDPASAQAVLYRLLHKAAVRLRHDHFCAGALTLSLHYLDTGHNHRHWAEQIRFPPHADTFKFNTALALLWQRSPSRPPPILKVGIVFSELTATAYTTRDLFDPIDHHAALHTTLDQINQRYGPNTLYFGGAYKGLGAAPMRIAFSHVPKLEVERDG
ncbi:MAG: DNA polymerase [Thiobacillus sp.]|nr:DNA polymerase [Thiobacillus sp.]